MTTYTRRQIAELLEVEESFLLALEREEIVVPDLSAEAEAAYSDTMLERVRVASNLVNELEVNLAGVAIILRLREELSSMRRKLEQLARRAQERGGG
jgi:MerR family transcriptional regulator/heat shock protein HspR